MSRLLLTKRNTSSIAQSQIALSEVHSGPFWQLGGNRRPGPPQINAPPLPPPGGKKMNISHIFIISCLSNVLLIFFLQLISGSQDASPGLSFGHVFGTPWRCFADLISITSKSTDWEERLCNCHLLRPTDRPWDRCCHLWSEWNCTALGPTDAINACVRWWLRMGCTGNVETQSLNPRLDDDERVYPHANVAGCPYKKSTSFSPFRAPCNLMTC